MKQGLFILLLISTALSTIAQNSWSTTLEEEDREALEALVLYPPAVRDAILTAGGSPEILVRLERLQGESQRGFESSIAALDRDDQEAIWDLTRYTGAIEQLAQAPDTRSGTLENIAAAYPESVRASILDQGSRNQNAIRNVFASRLEAEDDFDRLMSPYPVAVQEAYTTLVGLPELLEILGDHLSLTVLVSDLYRQDPTGVTQHLDQLAAEAAERQAAALDDWREQLDEDPAMREDLESATAEYAEEQGWDESEYTVAPQTTNVQVQYVNNPYPYWYGYPWWQPVPRWTPYPYWYDWGYYYGNRGSVVVFGMPTYSFWSWYYRRPNRHYYYPNLTGGCVAYYYNHRRVGVSLTGPTRDYITRTESIAGRDVLRNPKTRTEAIRDVGRMDWDYAQATENTTRNTSRVDLVRENPGRYPSLQPDRVAQATRTEVKRPVSSETRPAANTTRSPVRYDAPKGTDRNTAAPKPADRPSAVPSQRPTRAPAAPRAVTAPDRNNQRTPVRTTRPEDIHQGSWNRSNPARSAPARTTPVRSAPSTRPSAPKSSTPKVTKPAPSRSTSPPRSAAPSRKKTTDAQADGTRRYSRP